jgi:hypothetical protein
LLLSGRILVVTVSWISRSDRRVHGDRDLVADSDLTRRLGSGERPRSLTVVDGDVGSPARYRHRACDEPGPQCTTEQRDAATHADAGADPDLDWAPLSAKRRPGVRGTLSRVRADAPPASALPPALPVGRLPRDWQRDPGERQACSHC